MKKYHFKHTVKIRKKQHDSFGYILLVLRGAMPLIAYLLISKVLNDFPFPGLNFKMPIELLFVTILIFITNTFFIWHFSPVSLSKVQRIKNTLKKIIEINKFYYENKELNKILNSMVFKFYWADSNLYIEVYPNGAAFTNKMNELTSIFQTSLNLTVISVQSDFADHSTYVLSNTANNFIDVTNDWNV
jgi:hypothetical protein